MPSILHRFTIDAPRERVHQLLATNNGIERWWTGRPVTGDGRFSISFRDAVDPAATFDVLDRAPDRIAWRCVAGPSAWIDTEITYMLTPRADGGTTLLFRHDGWQEESEFLHGCSTNWAAYLMSLKSGAEGRGFNAFPGGEMSRWD